ncbi:hypothetical protein M8C21_008453 [Ambrosia artemisiifolia]|uniref:NLP1-9 GAF domain-containing protein n=1 Tax=Ambrosia artemisiifolia TaxID=4212 RepID=A0AAD5D1D4_AMBAR|nr:hypothetical protein M8C21_008453 [Ambrosia artemisiifolia]
MEGDRTINTPSRSSGGREASWIDETSEEDVNPNPRIFSAFEGVKSFRFKRMFFQFWRLIADDDGRQLLESLGCVYAVSPYNRCLLHKYRASCIKYQYSIQELDDDDPAWIITGGPFAAAFLNRFPEVVMDLRVLRGSPLAVCALECELMCSVILPVLYSGSSDCVGVIECSMKHPALLLPIFNELKRELERVGLSIYYVQGTWPYNETMSGGDLEAAKVEIVKALEIASESYASTLGQVWIQGGESHLLVKLGGYYSVYSDDDPLSSVKDFYDKLDLISLKMGEGGLAWRTLQTRQLHLCTNLYKSRNNKGVLALLSNSKCASFMMCLRSTHTGDLDYLFEFYLPIKCDHLIMIRTLLSTLRSYLPSFKFGDDIFVIDIDNLFATNYVKIVLGNQLSESPKALYETSTSVGEKRKMSDLNQSIRYPLTNINNPEGEDDGQEEEDDDDDDELPILATYRHETSLFYLPSFSTLENVMEKLRTEFELDRARTYKVKYEVSPGHWSSLACLQSCRVTEDMGPVRLRVLSNVKEVGWRWRTNTV